MTDSIEVTVGGKVERWEHLSRTAEQFAAVKKIVEQDDFDFSVHANLFLAEFRSYKKGPLLFAFYTKDRKLHGVRIGQRGKILFKTTA